MEVAKNQQLSCDKVELTIPQKRDRSLRIAVQILAIIGIAAGFILVRYFIN
jgi:hypothetical protein